MCYFVGAEENHHMPRLIEAAATVEAAGTPPKRIEEFVGRVSTGHDIVSIARMHSPAGWSEPGQRPEFLEVSVVFRGALHVEHERGTLIVGPGQAVVCDAGEWVRYSTPGPGGAEYVAICLPAFSPERVRRDPN
jgi:mannose-6-phosphate isomerase-like protein (cupin superfamily)